jgi:hypothetical protein
VGQNFYFSEVVKKFFKIRLPQQTFCLSPDRLPQQSFDGFYNIELFKQIIRGNP